MGEEKSTARRWRRLHEHGHHDDIRYRGPLTYQAFSILGWLCIAAATAALMIALCLKLNPGMESRLSVAGEVMDNIAELSLPLLLISNFARILGNAEGYREQLLRNGLAMLGVFALFNLAFNHFFIGSLERVSARPEQVMPLVKEVFRDRSRHGFVAFNIFVDLFMCTLFMFFLNYRPKRLFAEKWIVAFRLLAILPVAYEVVSIQLRVVSYTGRVQLPFWVFPLLSVKPPISFAVFMLMTLFIKNRERLYCRNGNNHEDYEAFLQTNRNSWHFSVSMAILLIVAGIVDNCLLDYIMDTTEVVNRIPFGIAAGIGDSISLIFIAPLTLLLSYTRKPRLKQGDLLIPVAGVALVVFIALQGLYQMLIASDIPRIDIVEIKSQLDNLAKLMSMP